MNGFRRVEGVERFGPRRLERQTPAAVGRAVSGESGSGGGSGPEAGVEGVVMGEASGHPADM